MISGPWNLNTTSCLAFVRRSHRMQKISGSPTPCGSLFKGVGMVRKREDHRFRRSWRELAVPQKIGIQSCYRVVRNLGGTPFLRNHRMIQDTVSSCCSLSYCFPQAFCAGGIFSAYYSDDGSVSAQPAEVETREEYSDPAFKHLDQNNHSLPAAFPPRKRKGFRYALRNIFGRRSRH